MVLVVGCYGYSSFLPWDVASFFSYYTMVLVAPVLYLFWKVLKRTKIVGPLDADLVWERPTIDAYEETFLSPPVGFWREIISIVGLKREKGGFDKRASVSM